MRHQFATIHELARVEMLAGLPVRRSAAIWSAGRSSRATSSRTEDEQGAHRRARLSASDGRVLVPATRRRADALGEPVKAMMPSTVASCDRGAFDELVRPLLG
jgi:hypothetical protein